MEPTLAITYNIKLSDIKHPREALTMTNLANTITRSQTAPGDASIDKTVIGVEFEKLVNYIEVDLWSRFQGRLWKIFSAFLTVATVAGIFGIPYYIKNEISTRLQLQAATYAATFDEISALVKARSLLQAEYDSRFYEVTFTIQNLSYLLEQSENKNDFWHLSMILNYIISQPDFSQLIDGGPITTGIFTRLTQDQLKTKIATPRIRTFESLGINGSGGFTEQHPVLDGTLGGFLEDLKYKIIKIQTLKETLSALDTSLAQTGGLDDVGHRINELRLDALKHADTKHIYELDLASILNTHFLTDAEKEKFQKIRKAYDVSWISSGR